jgi:hypothetical protein
MDLLCAEEMNRLEIPTDVEQGLNNAAHGSMGEHAEIQIIRHFLQNPNITPILPYIAVSKLGCFLCTEFMKKLQEPGIPGSPPIEFSSRGTHGKIYARWRIPADMVLPADVEQRVINVLSQISVGLEGHVKAYLSRFISPRPLLSDSPLWSPQELQGGARAAADLDLEWF